MRKLLSIVWGSMFFFPLISFATSATTTVNNISYYDGPNFNEWLFVQGVIIFLLAYPFWIKFFRPQNQTL